MTDQITLDRIGEVMKIILTELKTVGGQARPKQLFERAEPKLHLTPYEREVLAKSGHIRWRAWVYFYSVDFSKAGYIEKRGGTWYLTPLGEEALGLSASDLIRRASRRYREWKKGAGSSSEPPAADAAIEEESVTRQTAYEQAVEQAQTEIERHIRGLGPYDFQKLVAELLIGMGYFVSYIAPPGPDGGVDIIAYRDPLGTATPHVRVQVKHRDQKMSAKDIRELAGVLHKADDIGLIVSSGGFTAEAEREARIGNRHIETMDLGRLIELWQQHHAHIRESGKKLLPLVTLHFLAPIEEE